jgi:nucleoid-associated protein EbfC
MAKAVRIDPSLIDPKDAGMLEDLLVAAMNDARAKVDARMSDEMAKVTGGLPLPPGMKF